jgi:hypothetical protein
MSGLLIPMPKALVATAIARGVCMNRSWLAVRAAVSMPAW